MIINNFQTLQDNFEKHMDEKNRLLQMQNQLQTHFDRLKNSNACSVKRSNSVSSDDSAYSYLSSSPSNSDSGGENISIVKIVH